MADASDAKATSTAGRVEVTDGVATALQTLASGAESAALGPSYSVRLSYTQRSCSSSDTSSNVTATTCSEQHRRSEASHQTVIAKFHYTSPTGPDRTGPDQKKSAHVVGYELNSTTRARHGSDRTRTDPHGLFCGETPLGPCGSPTKCVRVRSDPCRARVVEFSSYPTTCADFFWSGTS